MAFTSSYIITGSLRSALRAGLVSGALAFVGSQFANKGGADAANSGSKAAAGGAGDTASGTAVQSTAPSTTSAGSTAGFWKQINPFDLAAQVIQAIDPKAGAILNFLRGGDIDFSTAKAVGGTIQNLISHYGKFKAGEELERFARKNGMTLAELNLALVTMSFVGNKIVGSRFNPKAEIEVGSTKPLKEQKIFGMFDRQDTNNPIIDPDSNTILNKIIGTPFDVIDVVLGYSGMLTASDYHFLRIGNLNERLFGHSLGTLGVSNLVSGGYLDASLAHLDSLPFGNVAPAGVTLHLGTFDAVNGFFLGKLLNPFGELRNGGFLKHDPKHIHKNGL